MKNAKLAASRQGYGDIMAGENLAVFHNFQRFYILCVTDALLNSHYMMCPKPCKTLDVKVSKRISNGLENNTHPLKNLVFNFKPIVGVKRSIQKKTLLDVITDIGGSMGSYVVAKCLR